MLISVVHKLFLSAVTIFLVVTLVFFVIRLVPGDPVDVWLGEYATPELVELTKRKWGLDRSLWTQYAVFIFNIFTGDLDVSLRSGVPVVELLADNYPYTVRLVLYGTIVALLIAIPVGIFAASRPNTYSDMLVMFFSFTFISAPPFWLGLIVLYMFSFYLGWFPSIGGEDSTSIASLFMFLTLPGMVSGIRDAGLISRMVRSTMMDTLTRDFITVARSKGLSEFVVLYKHALRNALAPIISLIGVIIALSLAGAVVLEVVFSRPGVGRLYVTAVLARDYPVIQGCVLVVSSVVVILNMITDMTYALIDPRIRDGTL